MTPGIAHFRHHVGRALLLALATIAVAAPASASANPVLFFNGTLGANAQTAGPTVSNYRLTFVQGEGTHRQVGAAAHLPGGWTLYGSYVYGWGAACHAYALGSNLGGMAHNPHTVSQYNIAAYYYANTSTTC